MSDDLNRTVVLTTAANEAQGLMIVAALEAHDVRAQVMGALTSGFRAEAPGDVKVIVLLGDLERAQSAMQAIEEESSE